MCKSARSASLLCGSLALIFIFTASARAQESFFEVSAAPDKTVMTVGDEVLLTVDILHGENFKVKDLPAKLDLTPFEVKSKSRIAPETANQAVSEGFRIVLTIFQTGKFTVPAVPVHFTDPSGKDAVAQTEPWEITVSSVLRPQDANADIRPIQGQLSLLGGLAAAAKSWLWLIGVIFLLLLLAGLGWGAYRFVLKWIESHRTPHERFIHVLDDLEKKEFITPEQTKEYYTHLTDAMQLYLMQERRFGSPDWTTQEFLQQVEKNDEIKITYDDLRELFTTADFVKFAKKLPDRGTSKAMLEKSKTIADKLQKMDKKQ